MCRQFIKICKKSRVRSNGTTVWKLQSACPAARGRDYISLTVVLRDVPRLTTFKKRISLLKPSSQIPETALARSPLSVCKRERWKTGLLQPQTDEIWGTNPWVMKLPATAKQNILSIARNSRQQTSEMPQQKHKVKFLPASNSSFHLHRWNAQKRAAIK